MTDIAAWFAQYPWSIYVIAMLLPFVQEDTAVIGAATTASTGQGDPFGILAATWAGLIVSDGWKYWAGRLAHKHPWAARLAAGPRVSAARDQVLARLGIALVSARFVPGTRIPLYVACGLFGAPFAKFLPLIMLSAALYLGLASTVFITLGAALGDQVRAAMPFVVVPLVLVIVVIVWGRNASRGPASDA